MTPLPSTTWSLRARLIALVVVLVAFDAVAVAVAYVLGHIAFGLLPLVGYDTGTLFWTMGFDIVPLWPVVLVGTPLVLAVQSIYGYRVTLRDSGTTATESSASAPESVGAMRAKVRRSEAADRLRERVARLAQTADMATPDVTVIDSETPNSYVASRPGEQTLFVTTALVDHLDDAELDAVIAHELAHLKNGDAFVMTAAAFLPTVSALVTRTLGRTLQYSVFCHWFLGGDDRDGTWVAGGNIHLVMLLFAVIAIPVTATLYLASTACYRLLSRIREYAADAGGVAICGSPAALASALETLTDDQRPDTDIRTAETGVRELCVVPHAMTVDERTAANGRAERFAHRLRTLSEQLLPGSHPDVDDRIAALQERQSAFDQRKRP